MKEEISINTDKSKLNLELIHSFITYTYWAEGRTIEAMQICINNSLNFGVYLNDNQIGYGRIVTDYIQFAYIMDIFIIEKHRGKGYSKQLMTYIMTHPKLKEVKVWRLATSDAHRLYKLFGFTALANPEKLMEYIR
jgi:GNAT superfamily N-acetyltransferase